MKEACQLASRESIRAFYLNGVLLIVASGSVSAGDRVDIDIDRASGPPLEFRLERCPRPGAWPDVMVPYTYREFFLLTRYPHHVRVAGTILVHHQDGTDEVRLEGSPQGLPSGLQASEEVGEQRTATGYSSNLSFDEAFANALRILGSGGNTHPDELLHVRVEEVGGLFGGLPGFHDLYVTLVAPRRIDPGPIVEVAPGRPGPVITEIAPQRPGQGGRQAEVITEIAPDRVTRPEGEVVTEVAPNRVPRPLGEVIAEVGPDRPDEYRRQGPISEVAPERPETS